MTVSGVLHTQDGQGRFECSQAEVSGMPVPEIVLQELVGYYSRTAEDPDGIRSTSRSRFRQASGRSKSAKVRPSSFKAQSMPVRNVNARPGTRRVMAGH